MDFLPEKPTGDNAVGDSQKGKSAGADLPSRYTLRERDGKRELICRESPSMAVRVERGLSIPGPAARKSPSGSIFLDGVVQEGPFLDVEKHIYNLDHHQGCVRSFTLATCEQAMVVVRKGLDLQGRDWTIYANEPDLDTVLAIWVLLNHIHINDKDGGIRSRIMPLVRLQGTIDAHGLEMQDLCGYSEELREATFAELERLRAGEIELKKEGRWQECDFLEYTAGVLRTLDALVYPERHFEEVLEVEELARADIGDRSLAIVCRSDAGIYEVERYLRRVHGKRLGIIVLQKDARTYTLRQVDAFLPASLEIIYERLNLLDTTAGSRSSGNRWGGSSEIGGSPRTTGTKLTPQQIADACATALIKATPSQRLSVVLMSLFSSAVVILGPILAIFVFGLTVEPGASLENEILHRVGLFTVLICLLGGTFLAMAARPFARPYGLCLPAGWDWILLLPAALVGGFLSGNWLYSAALSVKGSLLLWGWGPWLVVLGLPAAAEVFFRGFAHGLLAEDFRAQSSGGRWFLSGPALITTVLYALWSLIPFLPLYSAGAPMKIAGAALFGLSVAVVRERSESLLPPLLFHWATVLVMILLRGTFLIAEPGA